MVMSAAVILFNSIKENTNFNDDYFIVSHFIKSCFAMSSVVEQIVFFQ